MSIPDSQDEVQEILIKHMEKMHKETTSVFSVFERMLVRVFRWEGEESDDEDNALEEELGWPSKNPYAGASQQIRNPFALRALLSTIRDKKAVKFQDDHASVIAVVRSVGEIVQRFKDVTLRDASQTKRHVQGETASKLDRARRAHYLDTENELRRARAMLAAKEREIENRVQIAIAAARNQALADMEGTEGEIKQEDVHLQAKAMRLQEQLAAVSAELSSVSTELQKAQKTAKRLETELEEERTRFREAENLAFDRYQAAVEEMEIVRREIGIARETAREKVEAAEVLEAKLKETNRLVEEQTTFLEAFRKQAAVAKQDAADRMREELSSSAKHEEKSAELRKEAQEAGREVIRLRAELRKVERHREENEELKIKVTEREDEIKELRVELKNTVERCENEKEQLKIAHKTQAAEFTRRTKEEMDAALRHVKKQNAKQSNALMEKELDAAIDDMTAVLEKEHQQQVDKLKEEFAKELAETRAQLEQECEGKLENLRRELLREHEVIHTDMYAKLGDLGERVAESANILRNANIPSAVRREIEAVLDDLVGSVQEELDLLREQVSRMAPEAEVKKKELERRPSDRSLNVVTTETLNQEIVELEATVRDLQSQLEMALGNQTPEGGASAGLIQGMRDENKRLSDELATIQKQHQRMEKENRILREKTRLAAETASAGSGAHLTAVPVTVDPPPQPQEQSIAVKTLSAELDKAQGKADDLAKQLDETLGSLGKTKDELADLKSRFSESEGCLQDKTRALNETMLELESSERNVASLREEVAKCESTIQSLQDEIEAKAELVETAEEITDSLAHVTKENEKLKKAYKTQKEVLQKVMATVSHGAMMDRVTTALEGLQSQSPQATRDPNYRVSYGTHSGNARPNRRRSEFVSATSPTSPGPGIRSRAFSVRPSTSAPLVAEESSTASLSPLSMSSPKRRIRSASISRQSEAQHDKTSDGALGSGGPFSLTRPATAQPGSATRAHTALSSPHQNTNPRSPLPGSTDTDSRSPVQGVADPHLRLPLHGIRDAQSRTTGGPGDTTSVTIPNTDPPVVSEMHSGYHELGVAFPGSRSPVPPILPGESSARSGGVSPSLSKEMTLAEYDALSSADRERVDRGDRDRDRDLQPQPQDSRSSHRHASGGRSRSRSRSRGDRSPAGDSEDDDPEAGDGLYPARSLRLDDPTWLHEYAFANREQVGSPQNAGQVQSMPSFGEMAAGPTRSKWFAWPSTHNPWAQRTGITLAGQGVRSPVDARPKSALLLGQMPTHKRVRGAASSSRPQSRAGSRSPSPPTRRLRPQSSGEYRSPSNQQRAKGGATSPHPHSRPHTGSGTRSAPRPATAMVLRPAADDSSGPLVITAHLDRAVPMLPSAKGNPRNPTALLRPLPRAAPAPAPAQGHSAHSDFGMEVRRPAMQQRRPHSSMK